MAKSVVGLNIKIGANVASLQKDLGRASNSVRQFGANAKGAATGVGALSAANNSLSAGLGRAGAAISRQIKSLALMAAGFAAVTLSVRGLLTAFSDIDRISKLADRIGATTESIVGLEKAAELTGSSTAVLGKSLEKMLRSVGEAKSGIGAAKEEFDKLGLSIDTLATDTPAEAFRKIAEAINGLSTQSEKAAAAAKIFGRGGVELINMLALGRAGLDAIQKEVEDTGEAFDKFSGVKIQAANDAMKRMSDATRGMSRSLAISLAPAVEAAAKAITGFVSWLRNLDVSVVKTNLKITSFVLGFGAVILIVPRVLAGIRSVIVTLRALAVASTFAQAATGVGLVTALAGLAVGGAAAFAVGKAFDEMTDSISDVSSVASSAAFDMDDFLESIDSASDSLGEASTAIDEYADKWTEIGNRIRDSVATPTEKLREKLAEIRGALAAGAIDFETYGRAVRGAMEEFGELSKVSAAFSATPSIGAAVRGTSGGFSAVQEGQQTMKDLVAHAKKKEESDKRQEKLLADMLEELELIAESTEKPLKVKEHDII